MWKIAVGFCCFCCFGHVHPDQVRWEILIMGGEKHVDRKPFTESAPAANCTCFGTCIRASGTGVEPRICGIGCQYVIFPQSGGAMKHAYDPAAIGGRKEEARMKYIKTELGTTGLQGAFAPCSGACQRTAFIMLTARSLWSRCWPQAPHSGTQVTFCDQAAQGLAMAAGEGPKGPAVATSAVAASRAVTESFKTHTAQGLAAKPRPLPPS